MTRLSMSQDGTVGILDQDIESYISVIDMTRYISRLLSDSRFLSNITYMRIQFYYSRIVKKCSEFFRVSYDFIVFVLFQKDLKDLQKRLVVVGCQLRKTEISKRSYEVAVDKLTKFVEVSEYTTTYFVSVNPRSSHPLV